LRCSRYNGPTVSIQTYPPMEQTLHIRPFHPDDAQSVEFVVLSVLQEWGFLPTARDQQELEALQSSNPFEYFFVAEDPMLGVVGCAGIIRVDEATCEIRKIYLLQKFRGKSVGYQLLNACIEEAKQRGYQRMRLEVNPAMALSAPFYLRNGFVPAEGEMPNSTGSMDRVVYYKNLG